MELLNNEVGASKSITTSFDRQVAPKTIRRTRNVKQMSFFFQKLNTAQTYISLLRARVRQSTYLPPMKRERITDSHIDKHP